MAMTAVSALLTAAVREARAGDRAGVGAGEQAIAGGDARLAAIDSRIKGVRIGAITYSFRAITDANAIVKAMAAIGLGEAELMSNHAEALAGAPDGPRRRRGARRVAADHVARHVEAGARHVRRCRNSAPSALLQHERQDARATKRSSTAFAMAKGLGVDAITTSTQVSMAKRVAPFADKHRMPVAYHGHANVTDPDEVATPASFATCLSYSKYHAINLDIGHFTAAGFDPVAFLRANHARITNLHLKDRKTPRQRRRERAVGPGRHADQGGAAAAEQGEVGHSGEHRVRVPRRSAGRDAEVPPVLQGRARVVR